MQGKKVIFSEEQLAWLEENYANLFNIELCEHVHCGETTLRLLARERGWSKGRVFIERREEKARRGAKRYYRMHPQKGNTERIRQYRFKKGSDPRKLKGYLAGLEKMKASRNAVIRDERARIAFGLPQRTKLRLKRQPRTKIHQRYYLKKCGYILDEEKMIAYWTPDTNRAYKVESRTRNRYYKFMEYGLAV